MLADVERIWVVGNSGSGKTTLARRLAERLDLPHLELDGLNHLPGWQQAPAEQFQAEVAHAVGSCERVHGGWVVDGNYRSRIGDVLQPDTYVWLDYPRPVVFRRLVRRTLGRVLLRRELWNGNRERWRNLVSRNPRENILLWSWTQHESYRCRYREASESDTVARWVRLQSPQQAERWLDELDCR